MWLVVCGLAGCAKAPVEATRTGCAPPADPDGAAWFTTVRENDAFLAFAVRTFGPVTSCEVRYEPSPDGLSATAAFAFPSGATLTVQNLPPESGIEELRAPSGFPDPAAATAFLRSTADPWSVSIDWDHGAPEAGDPGEQATVFWAPDEGMNLSFREIRQADLLVAIRVSWAL